MSNEGHQKPPGGMSQLLRLFTEIRREEVVTASLMLATLFLLMAGYYVLKTVREPLILMSGTGRWSGAELRSYSGAAQALVLMFLVPLYSRIAAKVSTFRLVIGVTIFFVLNIQLFALWAWLDLPYIGVVFYIWLGIFNLAVIAQFWSFANDLYKLESGTRLFPFIAIGATAGSPVGAYITGQLIRDGVDIYQLMQVTSVTLVCCAVLFWLIHRRESIRREAAPPTERPLNLRGGFQLIFRSPYLRLVLGMIILLSIVTRNGEYILSRTVLESAQAASMAEFPEDDAEAVLGVPQRLPDQALAAASLHGSGDVEAQARAPEGMALGFASAQAAVHEGLASASEAQVRTARRTSIGRFIGTFYADFYFWVNLLTLLVQAFLVSRLVRFGGIGAVVLALPIVALGVYSVFAFGVGLAAIRWLKTAEKVVDYSVMNTARALLWLPTSREEKYNAKLAMDTFFVRFGAMLSALCVFIAIDQWGNGIGRFALYNVGLAVVWLVFSVLVVRKYRRLESERALVESAEEAGRQSAGIGGESPRTDARTEVEGR